MVFRVKALKLFLFIFCIGMSNAKAQTYVLDEMIAMVGDNYILKSDIEKEFQTLKEEFGEKELNDSLQMYIFNSLITSKILLYKAQLDSIVVGDDRVESEMERKLYFVMTHFGGDEKAFENYLGMSLLEFKNKTKGKIKEQLLVQEMKNTVLSNVKVTPSEVRKYFNDLPKEKLVPIPASVEVAQIVMSPKHSSYSEEYAKRKAEELRERVMNGEDFCFLAATYSDDPGSSGKCGELGFFKRGRMVPEFEAEAFKLPKDSLSKVIKSQFGFHVLRTIERRGESVNVQHILIAPKILNSDLLRTREMLDSLAAEIRAGNLTFEMAASKYSDDEGTKSTGGKLSDPNTGSTKINISQLDKETYLSIKDLKPGDLTDVKITAGPDGKQVFVIYKLISETEPHLPSLDTDYLKIQADALEFKKEKALEDWILKHKHQYYIKINDRFKEAPELAHWFKK